MRNTALAFAILFPLACPSFAQVDLPYLQSADTTFGTLTVRPTTSGLDKAQLLLNDTPVEGVLERHIGIRFIVPSSDARLQKVLVSFSDGSDTPCAERWSVLTLSNAGAKATNAFALCATQIDRLSVEITQREPVLSIWASDSTNSVVKAVVARIEGDKASITKAPRYDGAIAPSAAETELLRWAGRYPWEIFQDQALLQRFGTIMTKKQLYAFARHVSLGYPTYRSEGFLIGEGFDSPLGQYGGGMWGIRIRDGAPFAIYLRLGEERELWGLPEAQLPFVAREFLSGQCESRPACPP